jgi:hypothetical protein
MKWVWHVTVWKTEEVRVRVCWRILMERDNLEYLGIDDRIIKYMSKKWHVARIGIVTVVEGL